MAPNKRKITNTTEEDDKPKARLGRPPRSMQGARPQTQRQESTTEKSSGVAETNHLTNGGGDSATSEASSASLTLTNADATMVMQVHEKPENDGLASKRTRNLEDKDSVEGREKEAAKRGRKRKGDVTQLQIQPRTRRERKAKEQPTDDSESTTLDKLKIGPAATSQDVSQPRRKRRPINGSGEDSSSNVKASEEDLDRTDQETNTETKDDNKEAGDDDSPSTPGGSKPKSYEDWYMLEAKSSCESRRKTAELSGGESTGGTRLWRDDKSSDGAVAPSTGEKEAKTIQKPKETAAPRRNGSKKRGGKRKAMDVDREFATSWICSECKEAECMIKPEAEDFIICDGPCQRLAHYPCVGLMSLPGEDEEYTCVDCTNKMHQCTICQQYGKDGEDVFNCQNDSCGLFFHEACLAMMNVDMKMVTVKASTDEVDQSTRQSSTPVGSDLASDHDKGVRTRPEFICPAHTCWTCTQEDLIRQEEDAENAAKEAAKKWTGKSRKKPAPSVFAKKKIPLIIRCMECPIAYHLTCIPPMARFHELALLCHDHAATCKLPNLDPEQSVQNEIESKIDAKYMLGEAGAKNLRRGSARSVNPFFTGLCGEDLTSSETRFQEKLDPISDDDTNLLFCLPCDLKEEVHAKPPTYRHVHSLQYDPNNKPARMPPNSSICQCTGACGDDCLNRIVYVECFGDTSQKAANKYANCNIGRECGNRSLAQRKAVRCKPKREQGRGWGLATVDKAGKGDLIQEYVGEVIDAATKETRLCIWSKEHPNDPNFYIMALCPGWFIDAREAANLSRFINHSCDPNCELQRVNVGGFMRCAITAKRDIEPGEFLSYDYRFDTKDADHFVCRCGAKNCRGTMKNIQNTSSTVDDSIVKSKTEIWDDAKARYERDKKFLVEFEQAQAKRRSQVNSTVPCAEKDDELVSNGAQLRYRKDAIEGRIFLWRNAVLGSNFEKRLLRFAKQRGGDS